jgi:predicted nucleotide-binding protein (sugar kinase/HSP70/actin superfamily)
MKRSRKIRIAGFGKPVDHREIPNPPSVGSATHYRRPKERPFTVDERPETTILIGNLTPKHEALLRAVFERNGYRIASLPEPTKQSFRIGKEYCNNGLCNPVYYTAGALIGFLGQLEADGLTRTEISDRYVYLTLSDCGPCRLGMYESQYRQALENAGFNGFRVITTQLNRASRTGSTQPGLEFSLDQWFGTVNAILIADLFYTITYRLRPYEVHKGDTNRAMGDCIELIGGYLRNQRFVELADRTPDWLCRLISRRPALAKRLNAFGKYHHHFYGKAYLRVLERCAERLDRVKVDRTRARPVVKVVGEFYSHLSESDANYKMFEFIEGEGAEVAVGTITGVLQYWFFKSRMGLLRRGISEAPSDLRWWQLRRRAQRWMGFHKKPLIFRLINHLSGYQYDRINAALGGLAPGLTRQRDLAETAAPYYRPLTRGGEGHLEVGEGIHCTTHNKCHMVLSLKPFGCMPSTQSDGVMATVVSHHEDMLFASIETTGDSDINAYSRVQMVLSDAKRRAAKEYEIALSRSGKSRRAIRKFMSFRPELYRPSVAFRGSPGQRHSACTAVNYVMYVSDLMDRKKIWWRKLSCLVTTNQGNISSVWISAPRRSKQ